MLFCNILNLQGWGLNSLFSLHRHFIRLLWICFPVKKTTFSKYSYLPLLVIITITTIYIINKRFSQKMFYSNHQTVTWRCQFESLLVKSLCSGISMNYQENTVFWDEKIVVMWDSGVKLPRKCFIFTFRKSLKQVPFLEIITSSWKILVRRKNQ